MSDRKPKIGIFGAAFDTGNMGVSALAVGCVNVVLHRYPEAHVYFLNYDKAPTNYTVPLAGRQVNVPLVNMRFSWKFWLSNNIAFLLFLTMLMKIVPAGLRQRWIAANDCLRHLHESDWILAISGGDSFSDIYGLERMLYVSLPQILAVWAGKRLILLPQTLGPFKSRLAQWLARYIVRRAELVYSRDRAGVKLATQMLSLNGNGRKLRFCYDVGFLLDPIPPECVDVAGFKWPYAEFDSRSETSRDAIADSRVSDPGSRVPIHPRAPTAGTLVGLNVSGLLFTGGYSRSSRDMFGLRSDYRVLIYRTIEYLIEEKKAAVLLIPHVFGSQGESDTLACERLFAELNGKYKDSLGLVRGSYNQSEIKYIIGRCGFFSGARMHACIAAVSQGVPAVSIAYSDKFIGVMETIGAGALVADPRKMDDDEIINSIGWAFERRTELRNQLEQTIPQVKESIFRLFEDVEARD